MDMLPARLSLGTASWSCADWVGVVYSKGTSAADFIAEYARRYGTVEVDASFYRCPSESMIEGWKRRTPEDFRFALKVPGTITHEKFLRGVEAEMDLFLKTVAGLGQRLGPLLLQFPYFSKARDVSLDAFLERLGPFLERLPHEGFRYAVEVRNKAFLRPTLFETLGRHGVALALIDHPYMPRPEDLFQRAGVLTADFAYVRWLGDRYAIEKLTRKWDKTVIDRTEALGEWVDPILGILDKGLPVCGYVNNHFGGHAPADVDRFRAMIEARRIRARDEAGNAQ